MRTFSVRSHAFPVIAAALVSAVLTATLSSLDEERSPAFLVKRVVDGDTIDLVALGRVQLLGIDAPELTARSGAPTVIARQAQQRLAGRIANRWVRLEYESASRMPARSAYVFLEDGQFVNEWLVSEGLARVSGSKNLRRLPQLQQAEDEARRAQRGLWQSHR